LYKLVYKQATNFFFPISLIITLEVICTLDNALGEKKKRVQSGEMPLLKEGLTILF